MPYYIITYKNRPIGESGESCNSDYDLSSACSVCGTGAKLRGNLKVKGISSIKKDFFETLDGDFIISKNLFDNIRNQLRGFEIYRVINPQNKALDYYHFCSKKTLPQCNSNSTGFVIENQCNTCKRNGYFTHAEIGDLEKNTPTVVHPYAFEYNKNDFEKYNGELILNTWECFGLSNKIPMGNHVARYARPLTIVHERIKNIFDNEKIKNINYEQIIIE
jgi:hypothetical protein